MSSDQSSGIDQQVCPAAGGQYFHLQSQQAYVLAPESAGYIDSIAQPFDYTLAAGFWGVAFTTVVALWLVSYSAGAVINLVKRVA
ncbi:hypothetical protein [Caballeronia grimmiae]|uniref:hypothetical protein n=1 Tax=Caballeronia grimmiae TaxID=1071679 RepID=UPI001F4C753B|nr:hypothetical protein [Caballeronia grimmiae]